jgi:ATP-dependent Clp protease adaptor protein ClpS
VKGKNQYYCQNFPKKVIRQKEKPAFKSEDLLNTTNDLILYNDDINTFDFVIESLVEVCGHEFEQAEQCAFIAHFKGRCIVKSGSYEELKVMSEELTLRRLTVTIES